MLKGAPKFSPQGLDQAGRVARDAVNQLDELLVLLGDDGALPFVAGETGVGRQPSPPRCGWALMPGPKRCWRSRRATAAAAVAQARLAGTGRVRRGGQPQQFLPLGWRDGWLKHQHRLHSRVLVPVFNPAVGPSPKQAQVVLLSKTHHMPCPRQGRGAGRSRFWGGGFATCGH